MFWLLVALSAILALPLIGAILGLLLGRFLPKRAGLILAAVPLFLAGIALLILVPFVSPTQDLGQLLNPPEPTPMALRIAPTERWVQPPRTVNATLPVSPTMTATPAPSLPLTPSPTPHPLSLATLSVRNGTGETGLASRTASRLAAQGFRVLAVEDDPLQGNRPHTLILDRGDHPEVRQALAQFLHVAPEQVETHSDVEAEADIVVILGDDFNTLASATPLPTPTLVGGPTATPNPYAGVTVTLRNGTVGRPGLATRTADRLQAAGFIVTIVEDDPKAGLRPHTMLLDRGDHETVRQALIAFLRMAPEYVEVNSNVAAQTDIVIILGDDFSE